jgi:hypothetical protein
LSTTRHLPKWNNPNIKLFHGTVEGAAAAMQSNGIDPSLGRPNTDFGRGFYTTTWLSQAQEWAGQKAVTVGKQPAVVKLTLDRLALRSLRSLAFVRGSLDAEDFWSFVEHCRNGDGDAPVTHEYYDVVYGPVAVRWGPDEYEIHPEMDQISFHGTSARELLRECTVEVMRWP